MEWRIRIIIRVGCNNGLLVLRKSYWLLAVGI